MSIASASTTAPSPRAEQDEIVAAGLPRKSRRRTDNRAKALEHPTARPAAMPWPRPRATERAQCRGCVATANALFCVYGHRAESDILAERLTPD